MPLSNKKQSQSQQQQEVAHWSPEEGFDILKFFHREHTFLNKAIRSLSKQLHAHPRNEDLRQYVRDWVALNHLLSRIEQLELELGTIRQSNPFLERLGDRLLDEEMVERQLNNVLIRYMLEKNFLEDALESPEEKHKKKKRAEKKPMYSPTEPVPSQQQSQPASQSQKHQQQQKQMT